MGSKAVGKSSLITQYIQNRFLDDIIMGGGGGRDIKNLYINGKDIQLQIWDTVGQKQFSEVNKIYMKKIHIALIVYDITNHSSFEQLNYWIELVKEVNKDKEIIIGIAANKSDLYYKQEISTEEGKKFADDNNCLFFETSAKENINVDDAFLKLVEKYVVLEEEKKELEEDKLFLSKIFINN